MADLKRCDRCGEVWEPQVSFARPDKNLCLANYSIPADREWRPTVSGAWAERDAKSVAMELCRTCAIKLHYFLRPEKETEAKGVPDPVASDMERVRREKEQGFVAFEIEDNDG